MTPRETYDALVRYIEAAKSALRKPRGGGLNVDHDFGRQAIIRALQKAVSEGLLPNGARQKINRTLRSKGGLNYSLADEDLAYIEAADTALASMARRSKKLDRRPHHWPDR